MGIRDEFIRVCDSITEDRFREHAMPLIKMSDYISELLGGYFQSKVSFCNDEEPYLSIKIEDGFGTGIVANEMLARELPKYFEVKLKADKSFELNILFENMGFYETKDGKKLETTDMFEVVKELIEWVSRFSEKPFSLNDLKFILEKIPPKTDHLTF